MPSPRPIRVMILIAQLGRGGAERQVYELATRLDRTQFLPLVVTFEPDVEYRRMFETAGVEVLVVDKTGPKEPLALWRLASIMRTRRIDLVHSFLFSANWRALLASRLAGARPVICGVRSTGAVMSPRLRVMDRMTLRRADVVTANAPSVRDDVIARSGIPLERIRVILNGVDTSAFAPGVSPLRREWTREPADGACLVGFVGGFRRAKDPCLFVRAAAQVAHRRHATRFVMVGDGELRPEVVAEVERLGMRQRLVLAGQRPDMPEVFRALDLLVVTSYREGCCNAILEAMATGLPVVATAVGGNPDIVHEGETGLLFPYGDAGAGATAIESILSDPASAARMGSAALASARRSFGIEAMVRETSDLYRELA